MKAIQTIGMILLLFSSAVAAAADASARALAIANMQNLIKEAVEEEADKFTGTTSLSLRESMQLNGTVKANALVTFKTGEEKKGSMDITFRRVASEWLWLKHSATVFLIDGERWNPEATLNSDVLEGGDVFESVWISVPSDMVERFLLAKKVEVRVGILELPITNAHLAGFKTVIMAWRQKQGLSLVPSLAAPQKP